MRVSEVLFRPVGIDLKSCLPADCGRYAEDGLIYLLHVIYEQTLISYTDRSRGVHLMFDYLAKFTGTEYCRKIIDAAEKAGLIEVDRIAHDGRSNRYRLAPDLWQLEWEEVTPKNPYLNRKLISQADVAEHELTCPTRICLREWVRSQRLTIDRKRAYAELKRQKKANPEITEQQFRIWKQCIDRLSEGRRYFKSDTQGRVHHAALGIPRFCRKYLKVDGEVLVEIDIANSQPLLCVMTCLQILEYVSEPRNGRLISSEKMRRNRERLRIIVGDGQDARVLLKECEQGKFYETVAALIDEDVSTPEARKRFKTRCITQILYSKPQHMEKYKLAQAFRKAFPTIYNFIYFAKKEGKGELARSMQRIESTLIIDRVIGRVMEAGSETFALTAHDSVLVKPSDAEFVLGVIRDESKQMGFSPRLTVS